MKIIFMGTPDFAVKSLERLYADGHDVVYVFTREDKPRNRGMKLSFSPVKELAVSHGTPVYQPTTLKNEEVVELIKSTGCDLIVVVAYGKILPKEILEIPPFGCINIHASILPKYRGASPIQHAVLAGDKETGVTSMFLAEHIDSGDILLIKRTDIGENETSGDLFNRLSVLGAELLSETINMIAGDTLKRIPQNLDEVTYAPLLSKEMSLIDWTESAYKIKCKVRGFNPWPIASTDINGTLIKIYSVDITENLSPLSPGTVISTDNNGIEIACSDGTVIIKELQAPGGKRMSAADYIRGRQLN